MPIVPVLGGVLERLPSIQNLARRLACNSSAGANEHENQRRDA
ncbi:MAG TPA: hypothetical protein VE911_03050 [Candidatus Nitrosopolaris sp.]|nr:hypothetical protein [Candidatus Nitrosopolaris sp.]